MERRRFAAAVLVATSAAALTQLFLESRARGAGAVCDARGVAVQRDGKIVVVAHARPGSGTSLAVTRLTRRGRPDARFASQGHALIDVGDDINDARVVVDKRRRIVVYARHADRTTYTIYRLTPRGLLDVTFGVAGRVDGAFPVEVADFAVDATGRVVLVGTSMGATTRDISVARLQPTGGPDQGFGAVNLDLGADDSGRAVTLDFRGRIVVAANTGQPGNAAVVRLTDTGALDLSFASGGAAVVTVDGQEPVFDIATSRRGEPVVAAYTSAGGQAWLVAKLSTSGGLVGKFGGSGVVQIAGTAPGDPDAITVDGKGRVLVAGYIDGAASVARVTAFGIPDPKFGASGIAWFPARAADATNIDTWYAIALAQRNRIVVAGTREESGGRTVLVAQLRSNGWPDSKFGIDGLVVGGPQGRVLGR